MSVNIIPYSEVFLRGLIFAVFSVGIQSMNILLLKIIPSWILMIRGVELQIFSHESSFSWSQ